MKVKAASLLLGALIGLGSLNLSAAIDCDRELELCRANCTLKYSSGDDKAERTGCNLRCRSDWGVCFAKPATNKAVEGARAGLEAGKGFFEGLFGDDEDENASD